MCDKCGKEFDTIIPVKIGSHNYNLCSWCATNVGQVIDPDFILESEEE